MNPSREITSGHMTNGEVLAQIYLKQIPKKTNYAGLIFLIVSAFLFVSFGLFSWSVQFVVTLVLALLIHEGGHLLAMRIFRYKNIKMLFLPLFGALAMGEPDELDSTKIAIITLAGPLAGLLVAGTAFFLGVAMSSLFWVQFAKLSFFLNGFNLIPVIPLDGGQFFNEMLFNRFPKAELIFKFSTLMGLLFFALYYNDAVLVVVAVILFMPLLYGYKLSTLIAHFRDEPDFKEGELDENKIEQIREKLKTINRYSESERQIKNLPTAVSNVWSRVQKRLISPSMISLLLTIYLVMAAVSIGGSFALAVYTHRFATSRIQGVSQIAK